SRSQIHHACFESETPHILCERPARRTCAPARLLLRCSNVSLALTTRICAEPQRLPARSSRVNAQDGGKTKNADSRRGASGVRSRALGAGSASHDIDLFFALAVELRVPTAAASDV